MAEYHFDTWNESVEFLHQKMAEFAKVNVKVVKAAPHKFFTPEVRQKLRTITISIGERNRGISYEDRSDDLLDGKG